MNIKFWKTKKQERTEFVQKLSADLSEIDFQKTIADKIVMDGFGSACELYRNKKGCTIDESIEAVQKIKDDWKLDREHREQSTDARYVIFDKCSEKN